MIPQGQTPIEVADLIKDVIKDRVVCDIGCGGGSFMKAMSEYAERVIGIEENEAWGDYASRIGEVFVMNSFIQPLPPADVYYSWTIDSMGVYLKAIHEGVKATWIFGHSERPSTKKFLESLGAEVREINGFKVYIKQ